ncbi:hypothetical protein ACHAXR_000385, partial [Thalassiosira sp. AJA248-18]
KAADTDTGRRFISAVDRVLYSDEDKNTKRIAFDCEGVNLSRIGSLELVSICFPTSEVYLVDFGGRACPVIIRSVKDLFESKAVTKIIHDCRKDCDALYHHHDIKLKNVHDTSCFHDLIAHTEYKSLNDVLLFNDISLNSVRDNSVYKYDPSFWSKRPLTKNMIDWASSDVDKLFILADAQLKRISSSRKCTALAQSTKYTHIIRDMKVCTGLSVNNPGLFIGRGGQNINSLRKQTGTSIYQDSSQMGSWYVFYDNDASLNIVKRRMSM